MSRFSFLSLLAVFFTLSSAIRPDQLDIQLNESLFYGSPKRISYGLVIQIAGLSEWEDKHILDMAFVAHGKFVAQYAQDIKNERYMKPRLKPEERPSVTTTMIVDNTAYISTSLKGKGSYIYDPALSLIKNNHPCEGPVLDGLRSCQERSLDVAGNTRIHRRQAHCGEYMAALAFCIDTRQQRKLAGAKIVTIITNAQGESEIIPPCHKDMSTKHEPNDWGCREFTQEVEMHIVTGEGGREPKDVADEDIQQPSEQTRYP